MGTRNSNGGNREKTMAEYKANLAATMNAPVASLLSAAFAYYNAPQQMSTAETLGLAGLVAIGTWFAAHIGRRTGSAVGLIGGAVAGGTAGTGLGALFGALAGRKDARTETAVAGGAMGGMIGFLGGATVLSIAGSLVGFFGGAYAGHVYTRDAAMKHIFNQSDSRRDAVERPASVSGISYDRAANKVYIPA